MLLDRVGMRHHVDIVEAEIGQAKAREEFKRFIQLMVGARLINRAAMPWAVERARAEHVKAIPAECVPITHRHAQMVLPWFCP